MQHGAKSYVNKKLKTGHLCSELVSRALRMACVNKGSHSFYLPTTRLGISTNGISYPAFTSSRSAYKRYFTVILCCTDTPSYAKNVIFALSNASPNVSQPTVWIYAVCSYYPGELPPENTIYLKCHDSQPPFRYVIVQINATSFDLGICELQVLVKGMTCVRHCIYTRVCYVVSFFISMSVYSLRSSRVVYLV